MTTMETSSPPIKQLFDGLQAKSSKNKRLLVGLTYDKLDITAAVDHVRDHKAGAIVMFIGTTRDNFQGKPVETLEYTTYPSLSLRSLESIATSLMLEYEKSLYKICIIHRLGVVPIGQDSIVIALSTSHRKEGWEAGEKTLEEVKARVEIWKREWFVDGGIWRANRDGQAGKAVEHGQNGLE